MEISCLLDSFSDAKGKAKLEKMIKGKIIHASKIRFFDEFLDDYSHADLEDLFVKEDYIKLFNSAFPEYDDIKVSDLESRIQRIILQLNKQIGKARFNHYRPANELLKLAVSSSFFSPTTLNNFERVFIEINKLYK